MRFEVREVIPPRVHNPPGWKGGLPYTLITHCICDTETDKEYTAFANFNAAKNHCDHYNAYEIGDEK